MSLESTNPERASAARPAEVAARLGRALDATASEVYFVDTATLRFVQVNRAAEVSLGYSADELLAMGPADIAPGMTTTALRERVAPLLSGEVEEQVRDTVHRRKDGTTYPVELRIQLSRTESGDLFVCIAQDIAARLAAAADLRESREGITLALRGANLGTWSADLVRHTTRYDPRTIEMVGRPLEGDVPDEVWGALIHEDDRASVLSVWVRHLKGETERYENDFRVARADGEWIWLRSRGRVVERDAAGRALRAAGTYLDVTQEKAAAQQLAESEADRGALFESLNDAIVVMDPEGRVLRMNPAAFRVGEAAFGHRIAEGGSLMDIFDAQAVSVIRGDLARVIAGGTVSFEREARTVEGLRWFEFTYTPVRLEDGSLRGVALVLRDIHERKQAERAMLQAQKLESLGLLAGGIAHDFNNLLVGILGNAGLALAEAPEGSALRSTIADIETAGQRAADLARQMLAYSGRARFVIQAVDLNAVVEEMGHLLRASIERRAAVEYDLARPLPAVEADVTQIRQVVMNLVVNASDAMGDDGGGVIRLRTGTVRVTQEYLAAANLVAGVDEGEYVFLEVEDTGCGMDEGTASRIFDPFFTTKPTGRGLGLAAVLGIMRGHRGSIVVESKRGEGTTFRLLLPAQAVAAERAAPASSAGGWRGHGTILVIDDEATVRSVTVRAIESFGFATLQADDGLAGVELFAAHLHEVVCVLLDMTMPRLDGEGAFRAIRALREDVPILLLSGYGEEDAFTRLSELGMSGFVQKPYRVAELREAIRGAVEG